jgi:hypothetical protein
MYQGLAMPNLPLVAMAEKLCFLLCNWDFQGLAHSNALAMAYDNFLVEVGLYGSPLSWSFTEFGQLSTEATWFHNLWQLVHTFKVKITFQNEDVVHRSQLNDWSLMVDFHRVGYLAKELAALNIVHRF